MAPLRTRRRLHRVPDIRLAGHLAMPYRRAARRPPSHRRRPARQRRHRLHPAALCRACAFGAPAVLARPGFVRLQRPAAGPRFFRARHAGSVPRRLARIAAADALRTVVAVRLDRVRENAGQDWPAGQSLHPSCRHAQPQQRAPDGARRRLGGILPRQAFLGDASPRPRQAPAHVGLWRYPLCHRRGCGERAMHAGHIDGAKKPVPGAQRDRRHLCPAGTPRVLSRAGVKSEAAASGPHQPGGYWRYLRGGESRHRVRWLLLPRAGELCGQRSGPLRTRRAAPARADGARHRVGLAALRFHHRR
jgi:hypothetical protein